VAKLINSWFDGCMVAQKAAKAQDGADESQQSQSLAHEEPKWVGDDGGVMKALIRFMNLFDVVGPGDAVAVDAVKSIFTTRPGICDVFIFTG
jgi:condensin complex subunit 3